MQETELSSIYNQYMQKSASENLRDIYKQYTSAVKQDYDTNYESILSDLRKQFEEINANYQEDVTKAKESFDPQTGKWDYAPLISETASKQKNRIAATISKLQRYSSYLNQDEVNSVWSYLRTVEDHYNGLEADANKYMAWRDEQNKAAMEAQREAFQQSNGWFQAGAFEDGYQFGDVTKTVGSTLVDVAGDVGQGIASIGETALDAVVSLAPYFAAGQYYSNGGGYNMQADAAFNQQFQSAKDLAQDFVEKDLYDESVVNDAIKSIAEHLTGLEAEKDSVFAGKMDSLVVSGGQMLGTIGLQSVGVPWWLTTAATSMGAEVEDALSQGATLEEATLSGIINAGAEVLSEKLFGGSAIGEKGLINTEALTNALSGKVVKAFADFGVDVITEGGEEVFSEIIGNLASALYREENIAQILGSEEAVQGYIDAFIGGMLLSGTTNLGDLGDSLIHKQDYRTELTLEQQKLFAQTYKNEISNLRTKLQAAGMKLTDDIKREVYDSVLEWVMDGSITAQSVQGQQAQSSVREQIRNNQDRLNGMEPVANVQVPDNYFQMDAASKKNYVIEKLRPTGYQVERKGLGIVEFAKSRLKAAFNYFKKGEIEEAAFEAIPYVLESGVEVSSRDNHKDREYGTVTIAAPVTINGKRGNMAVVVKQTTGNHYKVHRILTPEGTLFQLSETTNEAEPTHAGESPKNGSLATPKDSASTDSISESTPSVNNNLSTAAVGMSVQEQIERNWGIDTQTKNAAQGQAQAAVEQRTIPTGNARQVQATVAQQTNTANAGNGSLAEQIRQENDQIGGNQNVSNEEYGLRLAATEGTAPAGNSVSAGDGQRSIGTSTTEQTGRLESQRKAPATHRGGATAQRIAAAEDLRRQGRLQKVSGQELGIEAGTENKNIPVLPREAWDAELVEVADRIYNETGLEAVFVMDRIQVKDANGRTLRARGVITSDRIIVQVNNPQVTATQIADHEMYHAKAYWVSENGDNLNNRVREYLIEEIGQEKLDDILNAYIIQMQNVYSMADAKTGEQMAELQDMILEEVLADVYAGINAFGQHAEQFTEIVNRRMDELYLGKQQGQENGTKQTNGPPMERFSLMEFEKDGRRYVEIDQEQHRFEGHSIDEYPGIAKEIIKEKFENKVVGLDNKMFVNGEGRNEYAYPSKPITDTNIYTSKMRASAELDNLLDAGTNFRNEPDGKDGHVHPDAVGGFDYFDTLFKIGNRYFEGTINIKNVKRGKLFTDITKIKDVTQAIMSSYGINPKSQFLRTSSMNSIYSEQKKVKEKFSVDDITAEDYASMEAELKSAEKQFRENWLRERLGDEVSGYEDYQWQQQKAKQAQQDQKRAEQSAARQEMRQVQNRRVQQQIEQVKASESKRKAEASKPTVAKKDLRVTLMNLFSIPDGRRADMGKMIDSYADRLIKNGELTEQDRKAFFDRMYEQGVMTVPAEEYYALGRSYIVDGKIYVDESVRADFGDDWDSLRKRAFAAGIYLTSNKNNAGIDVWNGDLAAELPGMFSSEDTDMRSMLERIVQVAEEGKDQHMSLPEYTAMLAGAEYQSEAEFLDNMERQMDWALRTFAEKANLEVKLKDRAESDRSDLRQTNIKLRAQEAQRKIERLEQAQKVRDRKALQEMQQKTLKSLQWLSRNRNKASADLKSVFDEVLADIDIYAVGAANEMRWSDKYNATWKDLAAMYEDAQKNDPNFLPSKELEQIVARVRNTKIEDINIDDLNALYRAAIGLRTEFYNRNNVINDDMNRLFAEVYTDSKREIEAAPGEYTGKSMDKLFNLDQLTPMNVIQRMAGWDPGSAFYSMGKQLERGERDMRAYKVKAQRMLEKFLTEHQEWVKVADGQGKDAIWHELEVPQLLELHMGDKPIFGDTVKVYMTPAQKVHMYLESKNVDNLRHMTGGRTFVNKDLYSKGKRQEAFAQGTTVRLAPETVKKIVSDLTAEELALAKLLDGYYNSFAPKEINCISNPLYGYDKAMGKNYAPIYTNRNYTKTEFGVFDVTAEGVGNLKGRQYAVNPSYNISAFDAFERHMDQTARFVGMAIPARNWTTLMNWREKNNSTADVITHKWGEESKKYIEDLITTLQAGDDAKSDSLSSFFNKLDSNYISAVFGANPSIVMKQLGSIPMAGAYLGMTNMPSPAHVRKTNRELITKYSQDLAWRTMGYATPETKQLKENPNWTRTNKFWKFTFGGGAITAMDGWAAKTLWPWAENKVRKDYPNLEIGTQAQIDAGQSPFYQKVAEEFENALWRSQSTSDEMHQSKLRKSKNPVTRVLTRFRSDSAQTYNALRQKIGEAKFYARSGATDQAMSAAKKAVGSAVCALMLNAIGSELVSFLVALWKNKGKYYRDDEDELTAESITGEMLKNMLGSMAGTVTGGEELFEVIGNLFTGEKIYDLEVPGIEQINDVIDVIGTAGGGMREFFVDAANVMANGGDFGEYIKQHGADMVGYIKEFASTVAMYGFGVPVSNLEAYLLGAFKWVAPEVAIAYEDTMETADKSSLAGLKGKELEPRLGHIVHNRGIEISDASISAMADLYEAGYKEAVPAEVPEKVSIGGAERTLEPYQQQEYNRVWRIVVAEGMDDMISSEAFQSASNEVQAKMLNKLYDYAASNAKAELFDDYELSSTEQIIDTIVDAGYPLGQCVHWSNQKASRFLKFMDEGLELEACAELAQSLIDAEEANGDETLKDIEKWRDVVNFSSNPSIQLAALAGVMDEAQFKKVDIAYSFDIAPETYVKLREILPKFNEDGKGGPKNSEVQAAIDTMKLTTRQKAALWQIVTGNKSAKNNPYSVQVGELVVNWQ